MDDFEKQLKELEPQNASEPCFLRVEQSIENLHSASKGPLLLYGWLPALLSAAAVLLVTACVNGGKGEKTSAGADEQSRRMWMEATTSKNRVACAQYLGLKDGLGQIAIGHEPNTEIISVKSGQIIDRHCIMECASTYIVLQKDGGERVALLSRNEIK